jgi:hypothetical protein
LRYTTAEFGEDVTVLGRFVSGRTGAQMLITVWDLTNLVDVTPVSPGDQCAELNSFGVYYWKSSSLASQPTAQTEFLYIMEDQVTGRTYDGKFVLGGFTDESAINRYDQTVWIDTVGGTSGTAYDIGTPGNPVDNQADAMTIASNYGFSSFKFKGPLQLTQAFQGFSLMGISSIDNDVVDLNGQDITNSRFIDCTAANAMTGSNATFTDCIMSSVSGFDGLLNGGGLAGSFGLASGSDARLNDVRAITTGLVFDCNGAPTIKWANMLGGLLYIINLTGGTLEVGFTAAIVELQSTCTGGLVIFGGFAVLTDSSGPGCTVLDYTINPTDINAILEDTSTTIPGLIATSESNIRGADNDDLKDISDEIAALNNPSLSAIVDGIWDEVLSGHTDAGSAAALLTFIFDIEGGGWEVTETDDGTMVFTKADNSTGVANFALYDIDGNRTASGLLAAKRERL